MPGDEARAERRAALQEAVRAAGALALSHFRGTLKHWTKADASPVTEADLAVNELLRQALTGAFPTDGWLSEESDDHAARLSARAIWVVDPIDGTRAFMAGEEGWAVSVALVEAGRPVLGALFAPATDEFFFAEAGAGATRNGALLALADRAAGARLLGGPRLMAQAFAAQLPDATVAPRIRSLALRFARVADGTLDAAISSGNSHDWDLAAADLLVQEAGGALCRLDGAPVRYNEPAPAHGVLMASRMADQAALLAALRASLKA